MKTKVSRIISILCAAAIAVTCLLPTSAEEGEASYTNAAMAPFVVTTDCSTETSGKEADKAIDGSLSTQWRPATNREEWISFTWDSPVKIAYVRTVFELGAHVGLSDCTLSISTDGTSFTEASVTSYQEERQGSDPVTFRFTFNEEQTVKSIKLYVAKTDLSAMGLQEFEAYSQVEEEPKTNLALASNGAEAFASGVSNSCAASGAIDGTISSSSRWRSQTSISSTNPAWIAIKLDKAYRIGTLETYWWDGLSPSATGYKIEISNDGETWVETPSTRSDLTTNSVSGIAKVDCLTYTLTNAPVAQYVRIYATASATSYSPVLSCYEFEVYEGEEVKPNLALASNGAEASASGDSNNCAASGAIDGTISSSSRWRSQTSISSTNPAWIAIKLDKAYRIGTLETYWWDGLSPSASGEKIEISDDGETWIEVSFARSDLTTKSISGIAKVDCLTYTLTDAPVAQYVRIYATASATSYSPVLSCYEFEVYEGEERKDIKQYKNGTDRFIATTVPAEAVGKHLVATYSIFRGGEKVTGAVEIKNAYNKIILGEEEITSDIFEVEDPGEYVTGIFLKNIRETDRISVSFELHEEVYIFLGSSVTYGANAGGRSFVELIDEKYDVDCVKLAVGGTPLSVGTTPNGTSYVERLVANAKLYPVCDHLNVQLSTNDATGARPLGTVSASKNKEDFDTTTIAGAIEYIIAFAKETWNCEVTFYTNPKLIDPGTGNEHPANWYYEDMVETLLEIEEKWGIRVLDMYNDEEMLTVSLEDRATYMADSIHPNATGYEEWWLPKFEEFLFGEE